MADANEPDPDADCFKPPEVPTEVHCLHCGREYDSYLMEYRIEQGPDGARHGFWCCGTPGCDGKGFGFDIFPTDPDYVDANGEKMWTSDDDEGIGEGEDDEFDPEDDDDSTEFHDPSFDAEKEMEEILKEVDDAPPASDEEEDEEREPPAF